MVERSIAYRRGSWHCALLPDASLRAEALAAGRAAGRATASGSGRRTSGWSCPHHRPAASARHVKDAVDPSRKELINSPPVQSLRARGTPVSVRCTLACEFHLNLLVCVLPVRDRFARAGRRGSSVVRIQHYHVAYACNKFA